MNCDTFLAQVDQVIRVQAVPLVGVDLVMHVFQHKHYARRRVRRCCRDRADAARTVFQLRVRFAVFQKLHAKLIQSQICNGNACAHFLQINDLRLQSL